VKYLTRFIVENIGDFYLTTKIFYFSQRCEGAKNIIVVSSRPGTRSLFGTGIFALVGAAFASNCIDAYGMTNE